MGFLFGVTSAFAYGDEDGYSEGCTDILASNFDGAATDDDSSCEYDDDDMMSSCTSNDD